MTEVEVLAVPGLLLVGSLLVLQAAANLQLSGATASPFGASTLQLGIGAAALVALASASGSLAAFGRLGEAEPWTLVGGIGSALYITAGILLFPRLGALVAVGLFIAGQMLASLLLDGFGWLGVAQDGPGAAGLAGIVAVVAGTGLIVRAQAGAAAFEEAARERVGWIALALAAGPVLPLQGAINGQLDAELDAATAVGAFSFLVATAAMALVLAALLAAGWNDPVLPRSRRPRVVTATAKLTSSSTACEEKFEQVQRQDMESFRDYDRTRFVEVHDPDAISVFSNGVVSFGIDQIMASLERHFTRKEATWTWTTLRNE